MTKEKKTDPPQESLIHSPEELGRLIRITEPRVFVAMAMGILMAAVALGWSVLGFVPRKVGGSGILVPPGGIMDVVAPGSGQITEIAVSAGQRVRQGQVIATMMMPELENRRLSALAELKEAKTWLAKRRAYFDRTLGIREQNNAEQTHYLGFRKKYLSDYFAFLKTHVSNLDKLRKSGSVTGKQLEDTRNSMNAVMAEINQCELDIARIRAETIEAGSRAELEIIKAEERISKAVMEIENLDRSKAAMTKVISPYNGRVVEIAAERGDFLEPGSPVALLKSLEPLLEAVLLFPVQEGKKIKPGMMAHIYPSTAGKEEYGCIYGLVAHISEYPATVEGVRRIVGNTQMIEAALARGEQMLWARVALLRDPETPTGFKWSSSKGPDHDIEAGTPADAQVVTGLSRPIDLVFPKFSHVFRLRE